MQTEFLIILICALIIIIETPVLIIKKMWVELAVFGTYMAIALTAGVLLVLDITEITPTKIIELIYTPMALWMKTL
jgi:regulator of protease activity HflC (stomatin/prohibitin superfamily)